MDPPFLGFNPNFIRRLKAPWPVLDHLSSIISAHLSPLYSPIRILNVEAISHLCAFNPNTLSSLFCLLNTYLSFKTIARHHFFWEAFPDNPYSFLSFWFCTFFHCICYMVLCLFTVGVFPIKSPDAGWPGFCFIHLHSQFLQWHLVCGMAFFSEVLITRPFKVQLYCYHWTITFRRLYHYYCLCAYMG